MSTRSEYYEAAYRADADNPSVFRFEQASVVSFGISATVFVTAVILAWKKPRELVELEALLPLASSNLSEAKHE